MNFINGFVAVFNSEALGGFCAVLIIAAILVAIALTIAFLVVDFFARVRLRAKGKGAG